MSYKKLVSLFAVSAFALGACGADETAEETAGEGSTDDLLEQAEGQAGEAFPDYGLTVTGNWTTDGYLIGHPEGEPATVPVSVVTDKETYNVYLLEDNIVSEVVSNEEAVEFIVADPSDDAIYHVGISPDDLGAEGDEVSEEDFARFEKIIFEIEEPAPEEE